MRVAFTGITGINKVAHRTDDNFPGVLQKIAEYCTDHEKTGGVDCEIRVFQVESRKHLGLSMQAFLEQDRQQERLDIWKRSGQAILTEIDKTSEHARRDGQPEPHFFLAYHHWYLRNGKSFTAVNRDILLRFRPDLFITLIDDTYDTWQRVRNREKGPNRAEAGFTLQELLYWRAAEIASTRELAENLYVNQELISGSAAAKKAFAQVCGGPIPHFVVAVKHPLPTFYSLLFRRDRPLVYASYPITAVRYSQDGRNEIDAYRRALHRANFTVIDPLTIDELRFADMKDEALQKLAQGSLSLPPRWPVDVSQPLGPPLLSETPLTDNPFEGVSIRDLRNAIQPQVVARDLILVDQVRHVAAYRPFYNKTPSVGVTRELLHASGGGKHICVYQADDDWRTGETPPFFDKLRTGGALTVSDLDELVTQIEEENKRIQQARSDSTRHWNRL